MQDEDSMGSLAQAARGNQLKTARWIMIIIGILSVGINGFMFANSDKQIDEEVQQLSLQGMQFDDAALDSIRLQNKLIFGAGVLLGIIFIVLGIMVYTFPVPCTIAGLSLYILSAVVFGIMDPTTLMRGVIIKIFIVVGLFKSVQSAFAYAAEKRSAKLDGTGQPE